MARGRSQVADEAAGEVRCGCVILGSLFAGVCEHGDRGSAGGCGYGSYFDKSSVGDR